jgi:hypothetical protein
MIESEVLMQFLIIVFGLRLHRLQFFVIALDMLLNAGRKFV